MTAEELREAQTRYQQSAEDTEQLRIYRDQRVHQAIADGWTHAQIAEATGLTRGRIGQLAQKDN